MVNESVADERLIVALDYHTLSDALNLVRELGDTVNFYKVGMELYYSVGNEIVTSLKKANKKIFLDLKLHDIPNTVASGLCSLMDLGADILNVHAGGGYVMMKTACDRLHAEAEKRHIACPKLVAVTVLTSISEEDWLGLGHSTKIADTVIRWAQLAQKAGLDGVVASPREAEAIRKVCGDDFMIITPGVRPLGTDVQDQSRVATPSMALKAGASKIVVGRPIRQAENPAGAARAIIKEIR